MPQSAADPALFSTYLKDRRARLDPADFGISGTRRRTPGLRREEVAQRANISATWYTWLEQGRGGAPSADVLDRIARALLLTDVEREHLYLLALGRPPEVRYHAPDAITPRLQHILDALEVSPALVRTATWDVVAWNRAAAMVLTDYARLPPGERNILRMIFGNQQVQRLQGNWENVAQHVVASFRADAARAGAASQVGDLVEELCRMSPDFARLWQANDVQASGEGDKHLRHPVLGPITFEYSSFAVEGRPDLYMVIYNPSTAEEAARVREMVTAPALEDAA
ncbi:helix-turn-helix transcriptional regulator [Sphingomonas immobilis]|uniref:Helix-turn-helix transcriptional regulator n=1 Tax=Sphingomonas immobilis TaxID=3063997 RepID=A0ABT9A1I4_9SPHN|nr:helix-turn-helix transcriptional regulator [Sphingomonas sp. CA1-15]MDO7843244.1 helix-turn-helix transcriptional regulator [Sphingomonas sp. CA1-15]